MADGAHDTWTEDPATVVETALGAAGGVVSTGGPSTYPVTSTTSRTEAPADTTRSTPPVDDTAAMTADALVRPPWKFSEDDAGTPAPRGTTCTKPLAVGSATVTLSSTAPTPLAGTPATPVTVRLCREPLTAGVSSSLFGVTGAAPSGSAGAPAATQPTTSATRWTEPPAVTRRSTPPSGPSPTVTRLATVSAGR